MKGTRQLFLLVPPPFSLPLPLSKMDYSTEGEELNLGKPQGFLATWGIISKHHVAGSVKSYVLRTVLKLLH